MKQASNIQSNQKQASKGNDTPIGAMSIVEILKELSNSKNKILFQNIKKNFNSEINQNLNTCSISNNMNSILIEELISIEYSITESVQNIEGLLNKFISENQYNLVNRNTKDTESKFGSLINSVIGNNEINTECLYNISANIYTIVELLINTNSELKKIGKNLSKLNLSSDDKKESKASGELFNFAEQIEKLKKVLDTKFILNWERFVKIYKDYVDKKHTIELIATVVQIVRFSHTLILFNQIIQRTTNSLKSLSRNLIFLGLMFILPPFSLGIIALKHFVKWMHVQFSFKKMLSIKRGMSAFKTALITMMIAAIAMAYIKWDSLLKLTGVLIVMVIVLNKFTGKANLIGGTGKPSINKSTTYNISGSPLRGMFGLCMGLMFLVIALNFIRTVNWQGALFVIGFIALLGTTLWVFSKHKIVGGGDTFKSMAMLSFGLAFLILSLDAANELNWMGAIALTAFIIALGVALGLSNKIADGGVKATIGFGGGKGGMFTFALGLTLLILCIDAAKELDFVSALKLVAFITAIQMAINAPEMIMRFSKKKFGGGGGKMSGMFGFALGLALLILCVDAVKEIQFGSAFLLITFLATLIGTLQYATNVIGPKKLKLLTIGLTLFISGTALAIGLAYICISENAWEAILIIIATTVAFVYVSKLVSKNWISIAKANKIIPSMIAAFALTNLAFFWLLSKVDLQLSQILLFALGVGILIGLTLIVNKFAEKIITGTIILAYLGVASILLAYSVKKITEIKFNLEGILTFVGSVIIIGAIAALFGIPAVSGLIIAGAITLIILGGAMFFAALGLVAISIVSTLILPDAINKFTEAIGILCKGLALNLVFAILSLPTALALIPITIAVIISAVALMVVSIVSALILPDTMNKFTEAIGILCVGLFKNSILIGLALIPAIMLLPVILISTIAAIALIIISIVSEFIKPETLVNFSKSVKALVDSYNNIGIISLIKADAKVVLLLPIAVVSIITALALKAIATIDIDENKIDKFGIILDKFITMMCDVVSKHAKEIENNKEAFEVVAKMATAAGSIVNVVDQMVNMTVGEWGINKQTGKLEIINRRQINKNDFKLVSENMGKVMLALIKPLSIIASDDDEWDFGNGVKVKNPFSKVNGFFGPKDDMSGVNRIKAIGDAFEKIPAIMQGFCENPLLTDTSEEGSLKMQKLQENIGIFFDTIVQCMDSLPEKSVLDNMFDGTATWLKETVQPVFESATEIIKKITPGGKDGTTKWEYSKTPLCIERIGKFWSETNLMLTDVELASKKNFDSKFAPKVIKFYNALDKLNTSSWLNLANMDASTNIASSTKILVNTLANSKSFNVINKNLQNTNKNIQAIVGNINKINITKAAALERNLKLLTQAKSQEALKEAIEQLKEMIGLLKNVQEEQVRATQTQTEQAQNQFNEEKQVKENMNMSAEKRESTLLTVLQKLQLLMEGGGIHADVNLAGVSDEIVQALEICGVGNGTKSSGLKGYGQY